MCLLSGDPEPPGQQMLKEFKRRNDYQGLAARDVDDWKFRAYMKRNIPVRKKKYFFIFFPKNQAQS